MSCDSGVRGAHGVVKRRLLNGAPVAVKHCPANDVARSELAILRELQGHPTIVQLLAVEEQDDSILITMEFIPKTLLDLIEEGKLSESDIRSYFFQLLDAVSYMHSKCIVHKDIKLENILVTKGRIRLIDFGFSRRFVKGAPTLKDNKGSLHYAAPEIWNGLHYEGPSVDVWAMGVTLFLLTTGFFPFGGTTAEEIYADLDLPLWIPKSLAKYPQLCSLIAGMLEVDMAKRLTIDQIYSHPWVAAHSFASRLRVSRSVEDPQSASLDTAPKPKMPRMSLLGVESSARDWKSSLRNSPRKSPRITSDMMIHPAVVDGAASSDAEVTSKKRFSHRLRHLFGLGRPHN